MIAIADAVLAEFATEVGTDGPVAVEGHRTRWDVGGPSAPGTRLCRAPAGIVELRPDEMTVRVRAGTAVADLHAALAEVGQRSALPERGGTVGGALAVGENHTETLGRGLLRASVLQVRYVSAGGEVVTGGGPTVKNVTGFDLPRLMVGSLGTLGLFAEAILRTNPVPSRRRWLSAAGVDPSAVRAALLRPGALLWDGTTSWALLEGHPGDVSADAAVLARHGDWHDVDGPPPLPAHRWSLRPSQLRSLDGGFVASIGVGTAWVDRPQPPRSLSPVAQCLHERARAGFDPAGRCNPGRRPEVR